MIDLSPIYFLIQSRIDTLISSILVIAQMFISHLYQINHPALLFRIIAIILCAILVNHVMNKRFRSFIQYLLAHILLSPLVIIYLLIFSYTNTNACLALFDTAVILYGLYKVAVHILCIGFSLHDWSVGIALSIEFAKGIVRFISNFLLISIACLFTYIILALADMNSVIAHALCISPPYIYGIFFITRNQKAVQQEIAKLISEFTFDRNLLYVIYGSVIFIWLLQIVDVGIENRFVRIFITVSSVILFLSLDIYARNQMIHCWERLKCIKYDQKFSVLLFVIRIFYIILLLVIVRYIWNIQWPVFNIIYDLCLGIALNITIAIITAECIILAVGFYILATESAVQDFQFENKKQRAYTLFKVFQIFAHIMQVVTCIVIFLINIGINISDVISYTSWAVIGFSYIVQSEIKHIFSGIALILEDAINIGDLIQANDLLGNIEDIGIRSLRLRSIDGTLHFIPFGVINIIQNKSRDFSFVMINMAVNPSTDINKLQQSINSAVESILDEMRSASILMGELEHRGIVEMSGDKIIYQARIKCSPGKQFIIKRILNLALKHAIDSNQISIPTNTMVSLQMPSISNSEYKMH